MTTIELAKLVKTMRDAQGTYFKTRNHKTLLKAKKAEAKVDAAVDEILGGEAFESGGQEWAAWNAGMLNFD